FPRAQGASHVRVRGRPPQRPGRRAGGSPRRAPHTTGALMRALTLHSTRARALLAEGLGSEPPRLDLAACAVAALEDEALDLGRVPHPPDALGARVRALEPARLDALGRAQALRRVLADEEGFWGDTDTYDAPENSFLDRVLIRKKGLPITLAV